MRIHLLSLAALASLQLFAAPALIHPAPKPTPAAVEANYGRLPLSFEANQGQTGKSVKFLSRGQGYSLYLTESGAVLALGNEKDVVRMSLANASPHAQATGEAELPGKVNYFLGNDPAQWHSDLPTYAKVRYTSIYPGIDLVYYGNQHQLEYDFVVAPGANPAPIRLNFEGQKNLRLSANGDLILKSETGTTTLHKPVLYQEKQGRHPPIEGSFQLQANNTVTFKIGSYDHTRPLTIDPVLVYSTYLGGSGSGANGDQGNGIAVDSSGSAYIVGTTYSANFPVTTGAFQTQNNAASGSNVFITKLNPTGTALVYSTYLGGTGSDFGYGIALDSSANAYVTGATYSTDFPVTCTSYQITDYAPNGAPTGFVTKLSPDGAALTYSTYLGGSGISGTPARGDVSQAIAVDSSGNAYVTGYTYSDDFPTSAGAFQTQDAGKGNNPTAFVSKVNPSGGGLAYSTLLGGRGGDFGNALALDSLGDAFVVGSTGSTNFPVTSGAFQTTLPGASSAFVTELNPTGTHEIFSTYLGGSGADAARAVALDSSGFAYIAGSAGSDNFPVTDGVLEGADTASSPFFIGSFPFGPVGFVTKLKPGGVAPVYSTFLEGFGTSANAIAIDSTGTAYIAGASTRLGAGLFGGFQSTADALQEQGSAFLVKLDPTAAVLNYATLFGGGSTDGANALALGSTGALYLTGVTNSSSFPTTSGAFQAAKGTNSNAFVRKFDLSTEIAETSYPVSPVAPLKPTVTILDEQAYCIGDRGTQYEVDVTLGISTGVFGPPLNASLDFQGTFDTDISYSFSGSWGGVTDQLTMSGYSNLSGSAGSIYWQTNGYAGPPFAADSVDAFDTFDANLDCQPQDPFVKKAGPKVRNSQAASSAAQSHIASAEKSVSLAEPSSSANQADSIRSLAGPKFSPIPAASTRGNDTQVEQGSQPPLSAAPQATPSCSLPTLTVTANPASRLYGAVDPGFTYTVSGLLNGDTVTVTPQTVATKTSPVGVYALEPVVRGASLGNYKLTTVDSTLTITPAPLAVNVTSRVSSRSYGKPNPTFVTSVVGTLNGDLLKATPTTAATSASVPGIYPVTANVTGAAVSNYAITVTNFTLTVTQAPLLVSAQNLTSTYGQAPPQPASYHFTGFVNGDTASVVSGTPVLSTNVTATTPVGSYTIQIGLGTLSAANYAISVSPTPGIVRVVQATAYVNVLPATSTRTYGASNPVYTTSAVLRLVNGDTVTTSVNAPDRTAAIGTYPLTVTFGGPFAGNYKPIVANKAALTITPAPLTVTVLPATASRLYGAATPTFTAKATGLLNGDTVTLTTSTPATALSPVGAYAVTATISGAAAANYTPNVLSATLKVLPAPLSLTATSYVSVYGQAPVHPTAYSFKGFLNGDTASVVSGSPALSTTVIATTPVGYYPIKTLVGSLAATNYTITPFVQPGVVHVGKASLTAKANNATMPKGGPIPTFTYTLTGFVNSDTQASSVTGAPTLRTSAGPTSKPGNYPIYLSTGTLGSANYSITPANGILTILP